MKNMKKFMILVVFTITFFNIAQAQKTEPMPVKITNYGTGTRDEVRGLRKDLRFYLEEITTLQDKQIRNTKGETDQIISAISGTHAETTNQIERLIDVQATNTRNLIVVGLILLFLLLAFIWAFIDNTILPAITAARQVVVVPAPDDRVALDDLPEVSRMDYLSLHDDLNYDVMKDNIVASGRGVAVKATGNVTINNYHSQAQKE